MMGAQEYLFAAVLFKGSLKEIAVQRSVGGAAGGVGLGGGGVGKGVRHQKYAIAELRAVLAAVAEDLGPLVVGVAVMVAGKGICGTGEAIHALLLEFFAVVVGQVTVIVIVDGEIAEHQHAVKRTATVLLHYVGVNLLNLFSLGLAESIARACGNLDLGVLGTKLLGGLVSGVVHIGNKNESLL